MIDAGLTVGRGELVALAGEPGAGKTTLVRCVAGDAAPAAGEVLMAGRPVPTEPGAAARHGVAVVWQDLALCDNLDIASNVMLGSERRRQLLSGIRMRTDAAAPINPSIKRAARTMTMISRIMDSAPILRPCARTRSNR